MKKINPEKFLLGALFALVLVSAVGCVVADRPYYDVSYRRYNDVRPHDRHWYYWNRDRARWHRDHDRRIRD